MCKIDVCVKFSAGKMVVYTFYQAAISCAINLGAAQYQWNRHICVVVYTGQQLKKLLIYLTQ